MSPDEIQHFLVAFDPHTDRVKVESFGADYEAAQKAYAEAELVNGIDSRIDIVLLSADSLETIKQTHSSYFAASKELGELLPS